jgi:hypothetical protein
MPRLSLYKPEKGQDYKFIDRQISEMFQIGGTELYLHKYIGTNDGTADKDFTQIQDLLFLENRDRKYDDSIYKVRGIYNVQNIDFNLSQFGLFIDNDTVFLTVHINNWIEYIGRKPISGDVLEFPHLRDDFAIDSVVDGKTISIALPRYYVVEDVGRASEGFSITWWPHLYRLKLKKITDSQQFADLLDKEVLDANGDPTPNVTLRDLLSTRAVEYTINDGIIAEAEANAPLSGYETRQFYTMAVDPNSGESLLRLPTADEVGHLVDASDTDNDVSATARTPQRSGYTGYLLGDGFPVNGVVFGHGISFPTNPTSDDYFLRTDFMPSRLFRFNGSMWAKVEDNVRMTMTNTPTDGMAAPNSQTRQTYKTGFINNSETTGVDQKGFDIVTIETTTATYVQTTITYTTGMIAKVFLNEESIVPTVINGTGGNARIVLGTTASQGDKVQWKLYAGEISQRQSLSQAIKPKADF